MLNYMGEFAVNNVELLITAAAFVLVIAPGVITPWGFLVHIFYGQLYFMI